MPKIFKDGQLIKETDTFDAPRFAKLILEGHTVSPDVGITPKDFELHERELSTHLKLLTFDQLPKLQANNLPMHQANKGISPRELPTAATLDWRNKL